ncbi:MAG TPA: hypothetical protein VGX92_09455 [Pyrinomonadaceae bacterium]|jgi:hypothetical protein|nr:hypothetical protein [Pyrinomonadaceae bacterium]
MSNIRKLFSTLAALILVAAVATSTTAKASDGSTARENTVASNSGRVEAPLNLAVLIQDDVDARVGTELKVTRDFIRSLPAGSRVMVGYIGSGSLQVRQKFTDDLESASRALRIPIASAAASPYNPYVGVIEALRRFDNSGGRNRNAILLISDGLDLSRGADISSVANPVDMQRAIREAKRRNVAVFSFFAPTVALGGFNSTAVIYGQGALSRLSDETGGRAFFQGTNFVTFDSYFERLRRTLNDQSSTAY